MFITFHDRLTQTIAHIRTWRKAVERGESRSHFSRVKVNLVDRAICEILKRGEGERSLYRVEDARAVNVEKR